MIGIGSIPVTSRLTHIDHHQFEEFTRLPFPQPQQQRPPPLPLRRHLPPQRCHHIKAKCKMIISLRKIRIVINMLVFFQNRPSEFIDSFGEPANGQHVQLLATEATVFGTYDVLANLPIKRLMIVIVLMKSQ